MEKWGGERGSGGEGRGRGVKKGIYLKTREVPIEDKSLIEDRNEKRKGSTAEQKKADWMWNAT